MTMELPRRKDGFKSGEDTVYLRGGEVEPLVLDMWMRPHTRTPALHAHPEQREVFHVLSGEFDVQLDHERLKLTAGERFVVEAGVRHGVGNVSDAAAIVYTELTPGLDTFTFFRELYEIEREGGGPLVQLAKFASLVREFPREYQYSPAVTALFVVSSSIGRLMRVARPRRVPPTSPPDSRRDSAQ